MEDTIAYDLHFSESDNIVTVSLTVCHDETGLFRGVQSRGALGRLMKDSDEFRYLECSNNTAGSIAKYEQTIDVSGVKTDCNYVQHRIVMADGVDDITLEPFIFDANDECNCECTCTA